MALPAAHRLQNERIFKEVFRNGKTLRGSFLLIKFLPGDGLKPRVGIVVSSKIAGRAVARNRMRRVMSEHLRDILPKLGKYDIVVRVLREASNDEIVSELERLLVKLLS